LGRPQITKAVWPATENWVVSKLFGRTAEENWRLIQSVQIVRISRDVTNLGIGYKSVNRYFQQGSPQVGHRQPPNLIVHPIQMKIHNPAVSTLSNRCRM